MLLFIVKPCETSLNFIGLLKAQAPHLPYYSDQDPSKVSVSFRSCLPKQRKLTKCTGSSWTLCFL